MAWGDKPQADKEADVLQDVRQAAVEAVTTMLSKLHTMDATRSWTPPEVSKHVEAAVGRSSNLAFDSWTLGLHTWRQLLELGRKYDTDKLPGYIGRAAVWMDPTAELASATTILELTKYTGKPPKGNAESEYAGRLVIANRSQYTHQLTLPRAIPIQNVDGKHMLVELSYEPDAPTLAPGDEVELWVTARFYRPEPNADISVEERLAADNRFIAHVEGAFGELTIRTRGPLGVSVPVRVATSGKARPTEKKRLKDRIEVRPRKRKNAQPPFPGSH